MELMQVFLPTIVVQPIGYDDAKEILQQMGGLSAPEDWQEGKTKPNIKNKDDIYNLVEKGRGIYQYTC
jgi:hypothetical protein